MKDLILKALEAAENDLTINMLLTQRCNFACGHCMYRAGPKLPARYMSEEDIADVMGFARLLQSYGVNPTINFVGGEPTYNLSEFARCMRQVDNLSSDIECSYEMTTNGWWLRSLPTMMKFCRALHWTSLDNELNIRVSNSDYHDDFRSERDQMAVDMIGNDKSAEGWMDYLIEHTYTLPDYDDEEADHYATGLRIDMDTGLVRRWLTDKIDRAQFFIDSKLTHKQVVPVGRALDMGISGGRNGSCHWKDDIKFTFQPGGYLYDPCCNGGHVPLGHAKDGMLLFARRIKFMQALHKRYTYGYGDDTRCRSCADFGARWTRHSMPQFTRTINTSTADLSPTTE